MRAGANGVQLRAAKRDLFEQGFAVLDERRVAEPFIAWLGREAGRQILESTATAAGDRWSHSDHYGFGSFPWHTDGAVAVEPPRWMVLACEAIDGPSRTELLAPSYNLLRRMRRCVMRVRNRAGKLRYLPAVSPVMSGSIRLRWDPRVCEPNDPELSELIEAQGPTAACEWVRGRILVVDNWRLLHRRPAVDPARVRSLARTYLRTD